MRAARSNWQTVSEWVRNTIHATLEAPRELQMTREEIEKMNDLCRQIATEKDPEIFDNLVRELNDLLELKHERIHSYRKPKSN